jgi:hypothetical protein
MDWNALSEYRDGWRALVDAVMRYNKIQGISQEGLCSMELVCYEGWVKFRTRNMNTMLLSICEFNENHRRKRQPFPMGRK